ncbi:hypothetical protein BofuT4_uP082630.1 [Botrytis cinerea T4]|uniref:Uncharacterized protein n=1 Tax=Botryotinia fuckeliana (strain T4) TaxID=999810 RepID=G2YKF6_BOTF4|nr:hypothetical protein BofuT4_uP082630.1 [Botrytis cinerea T4]
MYSHVQMKLRLLLSRLYDSLNTMLRPERLSLTRWQAPTLTSGRICPIKHPEMVVEERNTRVTIPMLSFPTTGAPK